MKKSLFAFCLLFAILTCSLTVYAVTINANQKNGITSVGEDVIKEIGLSDGDDVYKLYNCPVIYAFGNSTSIEEVLTGEDIIQTVYAVQKENNIAGEWNFYIQEKNALIETFDNTMSNISRELQILLDDSIIIGRIGETISVKEKYFFFNSTMNQGTVIYYETDGGDFIYYVTYSSVECLFPKDDFFDLMKEAYNQMGPNTPPGGIDITSIRDLSVYDINSPLFNLNDENDGKVLQKGGWLFACIVIASLSLVFICCYLLIKRRKRNT